MDGDGKIDYVAETLPQISREGQEYLQNIAQAMLQIQNTAVQNNAEHHDMAKGEGKTTKNA
jgi:hypothetical protein